MKKIVILFSLISLLLFSGNNGVWGAVGDPCTCYFDARDPLDPCKDPTPPTCGSGETCSCTPDVEPSTGLPIDCYPGTCASEPTPIPTPSGAQPGCDPYMTATGCIAINIHCASGYTPVVSADCLSCWCELAASPAPVVSCIPTAIGCIDISGPGQFVNEVLKLAIGLAGGIAMLLIIFGGIQILTSGGNPEKVKAGKELITSAIAGLLLIVFSVFILRIIGVEVLGIFD